MFVLYAAGVLLVGWRDRGARGEEFWTAGRSLSGGAVGLSLSAGFMSISWSCVYAIQVFYWYGLTGFWLMTVPWMAALAGIWLLARRFHGAAGFSQTEMVERRFGRPAALVVALALMVVFLIWGGAEIHVAARLLAPELGLPPVAVVLLVGAIVGAYSTSGGFLAVVQTDRAQYLCVASYLLVVAALGLWRAGAGPAPAPARAAAWSWDPGLLPLVLITACAYLPGWLSEQDLWLRVQAARDDGAARRGALLGIANGFFFVGVVPAAVAWAALRLYPPADAASALAVGAGAERVITALVAPFRGNALLEAFLALGLITAAMSTIDTCTNVVGVTLSRDLLRIRQAAGSRWATAAVVAAAVAVALQIDSLWDVFYLSSGLLTTTVALPVLATLAPRVPARAVFASSLAGLLATIALYFNQGRGWWEVSLSPVLRETGLEYLVLAMGVAVAAFALGWGSKRLDRI